MTGRELLAELNQRGIEVSYLNRAGFAGGCLV